MRGAGDRGGGGGGEERGQVLSLENVTDCVSYKRVVSLKTMI